MVSTVLGVSATNDFLHTGFSFLCARTNVEQVVAHGTPDERRQRSQRLLTAGDGSLSGLNRREGIRGCL